MEGQGPQEIISGACWKVRLFEHCKNWKKKQCIQERTENLKETKKKKTHEGGDITPRLDFMVVQVQAWEKI